MMKAWFNDNGITDAVVGYSGGIDSTVTALLLNEAGIRVHLVVAEAPNQKYSSPWGGMQGAEDLYKMYKLESVTYTPFSFEYENDAFNEAQLPILRVAKFYGVAAEINANGGNAVVAGTANLSEAAFLGFWGKGSDAAQDVYPISHLSKKEVYTEARRLNVPYGIINAVPAGDLLFTETNDEKMIGANYDQIEKVITVAECFSYDIDMLRKAMYEVNDPKLFAQNICKNRFKYVLPFPGIHFNNRLEVFRKVSYNNVLDIAKEILNV